MLVLWLVSHARASYRTIAFPHSYPADVPYDYDVVSVESSGGVLRFRSELVHRSNLAGHIPAGAPWLTVPYWLVTSVSAVLPTARLVLSRGADGPLRFIAKCWRGRTARWCDRPGRSGAASGYRRTGVQSGSSAS